MSAVESHQDTCLCIIVASSCVSKELCRQKAACLAAMLASGTCLFIPASTTHATLPSSHLQLLWSLQVPSRAKALGCAGHGRCRTAAATSCSPFAARFPAKLLPSTPGTPARRTSLLYNTRVQAWLEQYQVCSQMLFGLAADLWTLCMHAPGMHRIQECVLSAV
jgi:hypothetical protein